MPASRLQTYSETKLFRDNHDKADLFGPGLGPAGLAAER
jgi:hypothetical protein